MPTLLDTPKKFSMQQVFEILLRKPVDKSIIGFLTDVKTSGLENSMEMTYPTGARGNVYIGGGFAHSKRAKFNVTLATWNTDVLAVQNGTEVYRGSSEITYYDVIKADGTSAFKTKFTALGTAGSEISFVYKLNDDGTYASTFTQTTETVIPTGSFKYTPATKTIEFATEDVNKPTTTDELACAYTFKTATNAQQIVVSADSIPPVVMVSAYGLARDVCTGELFPAIIEGNAQVDGSWKFDLSSGGDPAVQDLAMEFVKSCSNKDLYKFTVFTEDETV